jgi:Response regulator containing CheY-like receiver, AAA-type ATPase, and DNA-binding domains
MSCFWLANFYNRYAAQKRSDQAGFHARRAARNRPLFVAGNVRELQNRVKRAVIMASGSRVTAKDLELQQSQDLESSATTLREAREQVEREMIEHALKRNSGKITSAAAELGISRPTLYELMENLALAKSAYFKHEVTSKSATKCKYQKSCVES